MHRTSSRVCPEQPEAGRGRGHAGQLESWQDARDTGLGGKGTDGVIVIGAGSTYIFGQPYVRFPPLSSTADVNFQLNPRLDRLVSSFPALLQPLVVPSPVTVKYFT